MSGGAAPDIGVRIKASGSDQIREQFRLISSDAEDAFNRLDRSASNTSARLTSTVAQSAGVVGTVSSSVSGLLGLVRNAGDSIAHAFSFGFSKVVESSGQVAAASGIAGAGLAGLAYAARTYTQSVAETVSSTSDLADTLSLPIDQFSRLQAAFRIEGGDDAKIGQGLLTLKGKVVSLAEGNQAAIDSFGELGLSMQNFRDGKGNLLGTREQLDLVLDRIQRIKNPTLQAKAVMDAFGQSTSSLGGLATTGAAGLKEAEQGIEKYGTVLDEATKDTFEEGLAAQGKLTESLRGLGLSLTRVFFPFFADSSEGLSKFLNDNRAKIEGFLESLKSVAERVKADVVSLFGFVFGGTKSGGRRSGDRKSKDDDDDDDEDGPSPRSMDAVGLAPPGTPSARSKFEKPRAPAGAPSPRSMFARQGLDEEGSSRSIFDKRKGPVRSAKPADDDDDAEDVKAVSSTSAGKGFESGGASMVSDAVGTAERFAEINGKRVRLAVARGNEELRAFGSGVFNYPIFGTLAKVVGGISASIQGLYTRLTSRAFAEFVGLMGSLGNLASQAGQAMASLGGYVLSAVSSVTGAAPTFTGTVDAIARSFKDFRRGLSRGFKTPWVENVRRAADDVLATLRGLLPLVGIAWTYLQGFLNVASAQLRSFTGVLARIPQAFAGTGPALEGALANGRLVLGGWLAWAVAWGAEIYAAFDMAWARVAAGVARFVPTLGLLLEGARALVSGFVGSTLGLGQRAAEGLTGAFTADRMNGVLAGGKGALDGFLRHAEGVGRGVKGVLGSLDVSMLIGSLSYAIGAAAVGLRSWPLAIAAVGTLAFAQAFRLGKFLRDGVQQGTNQAGPLTGPASFLSGDTSGMRDSIGTGLEAAKGPLASFSAFVSGIAARVNAAFKGINVSDLTLSLGTALLVTSFSMDSWLLKLVGLAAVAGSYALRAGKATTEGLNKGASEGGTTASPVSFVTDRLGKDLGSPLQKVLDGAKAAFAGFVGFTLDLFEGFGKFFTFRLGLIPVAITALGIQTKSSLLTTIGFLGNVGLIFLGLRDRITNSTKEMQSDLAAAPAAMRGSTDALVQQASLPGAVLGAAPKVGARLFGRNFAAFEGVLAGAAGVLGRFGTRVSNIMGGIATAIGLPKGVGAGIVGLAAQVLYSSGALDILKAVMIPVSIALAGMFYAFGIATFAAKFFFDAIFLGAKAIQLFYVTSVVVLGALQVAFTTTFAAIRIAATLFWAFMALSPFTMLIGIGIIVAAYVLASLAIFKNVGSIGEAWDALCDGMVSAWRTSMDVVSATNGFLSDVWEKGFFKTLGQLSIDLWHGFANLGIWAWNQLKSITGLDKVLGKSTLYGSDEEIQENYKDTLRKFGLTDKDGKPLGREKLGADAPVAPKRNAVADPAPYAQDGDVLEFQPGQFRTKRDEIARLQALEDARFEGEQAKYRVEREEAVGRARARQDEASAKAASDSDAAAAEADAKKPGILDTIRKTLNGGVGADGKPVAGLLDGLTGKPTIGPDGKPMPGMLDGLLGGLGLGKEKAPATQAEVDAFARRLREQGIPEADVQRKTYGQFKDDFAPGTKPPPGYQDAPEGNRDLMSPLMKRMEELLGSSGTTDAGIDPYGVDKRLNAEEDGKPIQRNASLNIGDLLKSLGGGLNTRTAFADGVPEPIILDARERNEAAKRKAAAQGASGAGTVAGNEGVKRVDLVIAEGDDGIYARQAGIDKIVKQLTDIGLRASTTEPSRVS